MRLANVATDILHEALDTSLPEVAAAASVGGGGRRGGSDIAIVHGARGSKRLTTVGERLIQPHRTAFPGEPTSPAVEGAGSETSGKKAHEENKDGDYFTKEELEANEGKFDCDFKALMLGNQIGRWKGTREANAFAYRNSLKGAEVTVFWPENMTDGECNNVDREGSTCWFKARILNDHQCTDEEHCLHYVLPDGEASSTYTCPTWVKNELGRCKLPYGWEACPDRFNIKRYDSGFPQEMQQTLKHSCGLKPIARAMVGSWIGVADKAIWEVKINDDGILQANVMDRFGVAHHAILREEKHNWYEGELIKTTDDLLTGRRVRIKLLDNGEIVMQKRDKHTDWASAERRMSYKLIQTHGGNADGAPCIFPFEYKGKTSYDCIEDQAGGEPWCRTAVMPLPDGRWGHCNEKVPHPPPVAIGTHGGSATPGNCSFPFQYKGVTSNTCITRDEASPWCKTDKLGNWGFCNCKVPEKAIPGQPIHTHDGSSKEAQTCVFPFKYKGTVYHHCISDGEKAPWCMTSSSGGDWGFCDCQTPLQLKEDPIPPKAEAEAPLGEHTFVDHCMGDTHAVENPNMIFDVKKNTWYRCSQDFVCEHYRIRAIKAEGAQCGPHKCPKDEACFVHYVDSKTSTYECVPSRQVVLIGTSDAEVYGPENKADHEAAKSEAEEAVGQAAAGHASASGPDLTPSRGSIPLSFAFTLTTPLASSRHASSENRASARCRRFGSVTTGQWRGCRSARLGCFL